MIEKKKFPLRLYLFKFMNTFFPKTFFRLSPNRYWAQQHWRSQNQGNIHGFDKYNGYHPRAPVIISEIKSRVAAENAILDLGCNCGYYLAQLRKEGFKDLHGVDIAPAAIQYGKEHFDLDDVNLITGSFEDVLPKLIAEGKGFDLVYTLGATIELVHPSFDIVGHMCKLSERYIILIISEWGHSYPRFWEYEFNRNGFLLVKRIFPYDGSIPREDFFNQDSLMVFERIQTNSVQLKGG
jgi:SAM-dependent methyltransferase